MKKIKTPPLQVSPLCGPSSFARLPEKDEVNGFKVAIVGVPFETGSSFRAGARLGPEAIRRASRLIRPYHLSQSTYPFQQQQCIDAGDLSCSPFRIENAIREIYQGAAQLQQQCPHLCVLGGDQCLSYPVLKAVSEKYGPLALVHFDSHVDSLDEHFGHCFTHATPFRRAQEQGYVDSAHSMHVGIRGSAYHHTELTQDQALGYQTVLCDEIDRLGVQGIIQKIQARVGDRPIYLSIDIGVLDPAFAPGTSSPEPGGFSSRELLQVLRGMQGLRVVGGDLVEVIPSRDEGDITALVAANLVCTMVALMGVRRDREGSVINAHPDKNDGH